MQSITSLSNRDLLASIKKAASPLYIYLGDAANIV